MHMHMHNDGYNGYDHDGYDGYILVTTGLNQRCFMAAFIEIPNMKRILRIICVIRVIECI